MANIKEKNVKDLSDWNLKELRKLKITLKNRIESLSFAAKPKELQSSHPLAGMEVGECKAILEQIYAAERKLVK